MKKRLIFRMIFIATFLPALSLIAISIYYAIFGYDVYTWINHVYVRTVFGTDAFLETMTWNVLCLLFVPVLPICILYQIGYIIYFIIKKHKKKQTDV